MCVVLPAASSIVLGQRLQSSVGPFELSVFEEQQDFHAWPIMDAGHYCQVVKSYRQGMKEHLHAGTCRQEHQVCTGFFDELEASAIGYVDRSKWDLTSAFSRPGGRWL